MDYSAWLARSRALASTLDSAPSLGTAAIAALDLARHRAGLPSLNWKEVALRQPIQVILDLTDELPRPQLVYLRVRMAAILSSLGRIADGRRLVNTLAEVDLWPIASFQDLSPSWAVILANCPDLFPQWLTRTSGENSSGALQCLSRFADDTQLAEFVWMAAANGKGPGASVLISAMERRGRLTALQACAANSDPGNPSVGDIWRLSMCAVCHLLLAEGREEEAVAVSREIAGSIAPFAEAARKLKSLPALRIVLNSPPAACGGLTQWFLAAEDLAEQATLAEVWPFFASIGPQDWDAACLSFEDMVDRGIVTRELETAARFVNLASEEDRPELRKRLALAGIQNVKDITPALLRRSPNWLRCFRIPKRKGHREALAKLAAADIVSGAARKGFRLLRRLGDEEWREDESGNEDEDAGDEEVDVNWIVIDICGALKKLDVLVKETVHSGEAGLEWDWPGSLMNFAVARHYRMEGFDSAFTVCRNLPGEARREALRELIDCVAADGKVAETLQLLTDTQSGPVNLKLVMETVHDMASKDARQASVQLAQLLIGKIQQLDSTETREAVAGLQAHCDSHGMQDGPAAGPSLDFAPEEIEAVLPVEYWEELSEEDIAQRTKALMRGDSEGHLPTSIIRWRKQSLLRTLRTVSDGPEASAKWLAVTSEQATGAARHWSTPPTPEEYFKAGRNENEISTAVKAAILRGDETGIRQWLECLKQLVEHYPGEGWGTPFRLLDLFARFSLAGHTLPEFPENTNSLLAIDRTTSDTDLALTRARVHSAAKEWDRLGSWLFESPVNRIFLFRALEELAWLLPDTFFLTYRNEFARRTGDAHWMIAVAVFRGAHPDSESLLESARSLNKALF